MDKPVESPAAPAWWRIVLVGRHPKRTLARIVVLVTVCFVVFRFVLLPIRVEGISMLPTYHDHGVNCINRLAYVFHEPRRGDVVGVRLAAGPHVMYLKRVVGLPGELVSFHEGRLVINGGVVEEPYVHGCRWEMEPVRVEADKYYVVGDNRTMPRRFHEQGQAPRSLIVGKALL
jgi:signal peptidase I